MAGYEQPEPFVARQWAAIYVNSLGNVPGWFAQGSSRIFARSLATRHPNIRRRESQIADIARSMHQPEDFLG